jgi:hypothetical protein
VRETVGLPGTGLSYTETHRVGESSGSVDPNEPTVLDQGVKITPAMLVFIVIAVVALAYLFS